MHDPVAQVGGWYGAYERLLPRHAIPENLRVLSPGFRNRSPVGSMRLGQRSQRRPNLGRNWEVFDQGGTVPKVV